MSSSEAHLFLQHQPWLYRENGSALSLHLCLIVGCSDWFFIIPVLSAYLSRHLLQVARVLIDGCFPHFQYCHGICRGTYSGGLVHCLELGTALSPRSSTLLPEKSFAE